MRMSVGRARLCAAFAAGALALAACGGGEPAGEEPSDLAATGGATAAATPAALAANGCPAADGPLATEAAKEGKVVMNGPPDPNVRKQLPAAFEKAYDGVKLEYLGGRSSEIGAKLESERAAGLYTLDVYLGGGDTVTNVFYKNGWLASLKDALDPGLLEDSQYIRGKVPWVDPDGTAILKLSEYASMPYAINTDLVDPAEVRGWKDLLNPKFRGKIVMDDPRTSGGGANNVGMFTKTPGFGKEFVTALYVDQKPVFLRDDEQEATGLAKGRYLIAVSVNQAAIDDLVKDGLPVKVIVPEGGPMTVTSGFGLIALLDKAPHPAAAKLLVNWLACQDGNAAWNKAYGSLSVRKDVPPDKDIPEYQTLKPGVEYFDSYSWEYLSKGKREARNTIKELVK